MTLALSRSLPALSVSRFFQQAALSLLILASFSVGISTTATTLSFVLAFAFTLLSGRWLTHFNDIKNNPALLSFWLLFSLYLLGSLYTISMHAQMVRDLHKMHWLLMTPFFALMLQTEVWRRRLLNAFLAAMSLTLVLSYAKAAGIQLPHYFPAVSGYNIFYEHIVQTFFLDVAAFIAGYRFLFEKQDRPFYLTLFCLITLNVFFFDESATGFLAYGVLITCLLIFRFGYKGLFIAAAFIMLLITAALSSPIIHKRVEGAKNEYTRYQSGQTLSSLGLRLAMGQNALLLIKKEPLFGYGTGGIRQAMQDKLTPEEISRTGLIDYVEITPLNFILEFGVLGLVTFLTMIWLQFKTAALLPKTYRHLMQAFLLAYLAASLINCFFISFCETHLYALIAAVCFSTLPLRTNDETSHADHP